MHKSSNGTFLSHVLTEILYAFLTFSMHVSCPTHLILSEIYHNFHSRIIQNTVLFTEQA
jgi:hypothetical protein